VVPLLQHGSSGAAGRIARLEKIWCQAGRDLATNRCQPPPVETREQADFLDPVGSAQRRQLRPGFKLPDYLIDLYRNVFENGLAVVNGDASWTLPVPARFVIAQDATILYAEVDPDYNAPSGSGSLRAALYNPGLGEGQRSRLQDKVGRHEGR
jgi:hypothetical protein